MGERTPRFADKLQTLMSIYRLNNITLARGIGADASLVSRWRNGERIPKRNSRSYLDIASFLAGRGMLEYDRETLSAMLGVDCSSREGTKTALLAWLQGKAVVRPLNLSPEEPAPVSEIFEQLAGVFSDEARAPSSPVNLYARAQGGKYSNHERFDEMSGLRQAVVNFFHAVMQCKTPGDVYLMPPADSKWLWEDEGFEKLYINSLRAVIQAGHSIHMLHPVPHGSSLAPLVSIYMPLYTTGRFFSYGRISADASEPAVFVLQGYAAVVSYFSQEQTTTLYFKNDQDIIPFAHIVHSQMKNSSPLAAACPREAPLALAERLIQLEDKPGPLYTLRNTFDPIFLPEKQLYTLLSEQLGAEKTDARLNMLARRRETLTRHLEEQPWIILLPYSVIDAIQINGTCRLSGIELLTPKDATLDGDALRDYLEELLRSMERFPLLRVVFADDCPMINLTAKEGIGAIFMADSAGAEPSAICVGDLTLCEMLVRWFTARERDLSDSGRRKTVERINETLGYI